MYDPSLINGSNEMSMSRKNIDPVEIESTSENGDYTSTYVFDISDHMLAGEVCTGLALALGETLDRDPAQMTPLSSVVDCDALQMLFHTRRYGDLRDEVSVSFPYDVYEVTVHSGGRVVVQG
ncbi:HalOD1 output domain-containing protein [Halorussus caseinilyticus]|uniref:HalOD1 output domain-containing protein n=1 Tax=Halorussus caseinilyticus TaxID=3034025 RepID=A0ABD5WMK4_9EURY|nr:HalOD1 output domain-containing protein [Halorussus sp. DT72]